MRFFLFLLWAALPLNAGAQDKSNKAARETLMNKANEDAVNGACFQGDGDELEATELAGKAKKAYEKAQKEALQAEVADPAIVAFEVGPFPVVMVDNTVEGNGCCRYFTEKGAHLADLCGTESTDWVWK